MKTVISYALRSRFTRLKTMSGQVARVSVLVTAESKNVFVIAVFVTIYSNGVGKIAGLIVKVAAMHGSIIVTLNVLNLPVSTPSGVKD